MPVLNDPYHLKLDLLYNDWMMHMHILHTSDWHLGKSLYDFSLLEDQEYFVNSLLELIRREPVDVVLLAGDIYDRAVPSTGAVRLYDYFLSKAVGEMGVPVIAIAGNHDSASRLEFGSSLYRNSGYHVCGHPQREIVPVELRDEWGPVAFYPIPFLHPADIRVLFEDSGVRTFDDAYRTLLAHNFSGLEQGTRRVALAHGFFADLSHSDRELVCSDSEISVGGMDIADAGYFAPFDYTALGHLHAPQWVARDRVRYCGTPLKYSLSEEHQEKSVTMVELREKGDVSTRLVTLPPLRDVRCASGTFDQLREPSYHQNHRFQDYVFAMISGEETTYPMEKLRVLFPNLLGLRFTDQAAGAMEDIQIGPRVPASPEELFVRFYRDITGEEIPGDRLSLLREALEEGLREEATV